MVGHPAGVANGRLWMGTFGGEVFVPLAEADRERWSRWLDFRPFAPMAGRPMREYLVIPPEVLEDPVGRARLVDQPLDYRVRRKSP